MNDVKKVLFIAIFCFGLLGCERSSFDEDRYIAEYARVNDLLQSGSYVKALKASELFLKNYPDKLIPYFMNIALTVEVKKLKKLPRENTAEREKLVEQIIKSGSQVEVLFTQLSKRKKLENIGFLIAYGMILEEIGEYEESIGIFNKYYSREEIRNHPRYKYASLNFANALASTNQRNKGDLLLKSALQNSNDSLVIQGYVKFKADHYSQEEAVELANHYLREDANSADVKYQLCFTYEQYGDHSSAQSCYAELIDWSKVQEIELEYLNHAQTYLKNPKEVISDKF
ncbi:hypothetical protein FE810_16930 [Thalassotalea litorea]|uniref:Tetratricopeptide repeat protein n=1 Tax=Thalassotalea litorea TaxID=2020715 RepID=A0A5R9IHN9_9GAMM|nr:hypothetical protein [Thalassotalea litorea]TLU59462.1 hypothetical protein FE810_16930 [Thalassotalea litorea]